MRVLLGDLRVFVLACGALQLLACESSGDAERSDKSEAEERPGASPVAKEKAPIGDASIQGKSGKSEKSEVKEVPAGKAPAEASASAAPTCPDEMLLVPGGTFTVGTAREVFDREENPQFTTKVAPFCADKFEVSTNEYESCVNDGDCTPGSGRNRTCNTVKKGRGDHPINCINHEQATAVCKARDARIPTEIEWEYMARGGAEMRKFPWGDAHPDDNTCWKNHQSCKSGSFTEGAFGLHDVVGNVWEWTDSWFGRYPWPQEAGRHKVFRGGSWSRRFEKWMRPSLRNRLDPKKSGSHLGVRCVMTPENVECPYGKTAEGSCRAGVETVKCLDKDVWNGVRCAKPGDDRRCKPGATEKPGYGCVTERIKGPVSHELDLAGVVRARSSQFDADCRAHTPGRPNAYRFTGGGHLARNVVGKQMGCKNRDVGVGFNSSCCP